ncbi:MAG: mechanosensitive ion channel family protein [bacterium]|nr:mechanosensitive ion channel family protein [bacterium]
MNVWVLIKLLSIILGAVTIWYLANLIGNSIISRIDRIRYKGNKQRIITLGSLITWVIRVIIGISAVVWILRVLSIDPSPFIAGAGILGLAISFASQNLIRDMINGFFIILENQYDIGDEVRIGAIQGVVEDLTLRVTRIRDDSGALYIIPNSSISQVANLTDKWAKLSYIINVNSKESLERIEEVLRYVKEKISERNREYIIEEPTIEGVQSFDSSTVKVAISCKVSPHKKRILGSLFLLSLKEGVEKVNLNIV